MLVRSYQWDPTRTASEIGIETFLLTRYQSTIFTGTYYNAVRDVVPADGYVPGVCAYTVCDWDDQHSHPTTSTEGD